MSLARRHHQTDFTAGRGNALQACVASLFDCETIEQVPNFIAAPDYWAAMCAHASSRRLSWSKVPLDEVGRLPSAISSDVGQLCLVRGTSPRGAHGHVVIGAVAGDGRSLRLVHDPHPDGTFLEGPPIWAAFYAAALEHGEPVPALGAALDSLGRELVSSGFDVMSPMRVSWYNECM